MTEQAIFYGMVHPVGDGWTFDEPFDLKFLDTDAKAQVFIKHAKFTAVVIGAFAPDVSFSNQLMSVIQGVLDALGFHLGVAMRAELVGGFTSPNTLIFTTPQAWPQAVGRSADDPKRVEADELVPFTSASLREPLVRFALADICAAIVEATDTGFLCYRAIESIRQWYQDAEPSTEDVSEGWLRLREALGVDEQELRDLAALARRRRHGGSAVISEAERLWSIDLARKVVRAFVATLRSAS